MDTNTKMIKCVEELMKNQMGLEDNIHFRCRKCGRCCRDIDIHVNPHDLFRIARYLGRSPEEVMTRYCEHGPGTNSKIPLVFLKFDRGYCPFLYNKGCAIHKAKPFVCAAYPVGMALRKF